MDYLHNVDIINVLNTSIKPQNPYYFKRFSSNQNLDLPTFTAKHSSSDSKSPPAFMHIFTLRRIFKPHDILNLYFKLNMLTG